MTNDTLLISIQKDIMLVGRKKKNQAVDIVNAFQGPEAEELYKRLITKVKENE